MICYKKSLFFVLICQSSFLIAGRMDQQIAKLENDAALHKGWTERPIINVEKVKEQEVYFQALLIKDIAKRMDVAEKEYAKAINVARKNEVKESGFKKYKHAVIMAQLARTELIRQNVFDFDLNFLAQGGSKPEELIARNKEAKKDLLKQIGEFEGTAEALKAEALKKDAEKVASSLVVKECKRYDEEAYSKSLDLANKLKLNEHERQKIRYQEHELFRKHLKYAQARVEAYQLALAKMQAYDSCSDGERDPAVTALIEKVKSRIKELSVELNKQFECARTTGEFVLRI